MARRPGAALGLLIAACCALGGEAVEVQRQGALMRSDRSDAATANTGALGTWVNYTNVPPPEDDELARNGRKCIMGVQQRCSNKVAAMYTFVHKPGNSPAPKTCHECVERCRSKNPNIGMWYASFKGPCNLEDEVGRVAHEGSCGDGCECTCHLADHCGARANDEDWNILMWCDGEICSSCKGGLG
eukprot:SRR837773.10276.p2 GENE.SRR837773.10276~~SRR837773.10276.p2  ORF type:complete len:186 (-),score=59.72 SRR837773.10276:44-601(-)